MTAQELYAEAGKRGLRLEPRGNSLAIIPGSRCPPDLVSLLRQHKSELLDWLGRSPCPGWQTVPPSDLPLSPVTPRPTATRHGALIAYLLRQTWDRPGPLAEWLFRREDTYYEGVGRSWDCALICYAAGRDAACWQLNRTETEVWDFLEGIAASANLDP